MQRVKNIDYDEDDIYSDEDEYGEGQDEYTAEDKDNFASLTPVVRAELDEAGIATTTKEIEDALWHYFWDVGKSVAYLKNARTPQQPKQQDVKKAKTKSKFDEASAQNAANAGESFSFFDCARRRANESYVHGGADKGGQSRGQCGWSATDQVRADPMSMPPVSAADWFKDTPWRNVPAEKLGVLVPARPEHSVPRLLGGSSKLARLAEERRRKAAAAQQAPQTPANDSISALDRLSKPKDTKENARPPANEEPKKYPIRRRRSPTPPPRQPTPPPEEPKEILPDLKSSPTAFGHALASQEQASQRNKNIGLQDLFGSGYSLASFTGPSPDDTVLQAQQGSRGLNK